MRNQSLDEARRQTEGMWPIDLTLLALGGLVGYLAVDRLGFDDPRWMYNATTYLAVIVAGILVSGFILRQVTGRLLRRSVEIGFLASIFIHLLLLIVAVNVVIFSRYWPDTVTGSQQARTPIRKTVPEHLFQRRTEETQQPDWAKPVDVQTASRVVPEEMREIPPMERASVKLEMPTEQPETQPELRKQLIERKQAAEMMPSPDSEPSKLARREAETLPRNETSIEIPDVAPTPKAVESLQQRRENQVQRSQAASAARNLPNPQPQVRPTAPKREVQRRQSEQLPRMAMSAVAMPRPREARRSQALPPAGAAPSVPSFQVARQVPEASRMLRREATRNARATATNETALAEFGQAGPAFAANPRQAASGGGRTGQPVPQAGMPQVSDGQVAAATGRSRRSRANSPSLPLGPPRINDLEGSRPGAREGAADDAPVIASTRGRARQVMDTPALAAAATGAPTPLDLRAQRGTPGLGRRPAPRAGLATAAEMPDTSALAMGRRPLTRREVGGPIRPAGSEVASVESFQRRIMRTSGSAAPAPAGMVGPETEAAIERGLEFLASRQNDDGSWSLEQPGERVLLNSDTAATGLTLLAFQGAGYTHRQHQYAATVARGLDFLLQSQKSDGDLYRPEDATSNRNVWLYSHAIAALTLCEAYGMTQDPKLREPAQAALDFIATSQHPTRGGWRYKPQNSSDTSVSGWMMMALKSGELAGLEVAESTYEGIERWLRSAQAGVGRADRYRYNPYAPLNAKQRHGRDPTRTMTAVGMLMRMYGGWRRDHPSMISGADYIAQSLPAVGTPTQPRRDTYYWYYATQVMFHMGGEHWETWNGALKPTLVETQIEEGDQAGSWEPLGEVPDRWSAHAGRIYLTAMNLLSLEVFYRHLPIYEETAR